MLSDNVVMSANAIIWGASDLWQKRKIKDFEGGELGPEERKNLDKYFPASECNLIQFTIGISYALPVRSVFG